MDAVTPKPGKYEILWHCETCLRCGKFHVTDEDKALLSYFLKAEHGAANYEQPNPCVDFKPAFERRVP